ncbi:hypothetical protein [Oceanisphaera sp. KMM 10153]|uniref:hypothetical protein n=1 Tax=Oceanisphaera submarina TaxID=3390193 RepID=UPI003976277A
MQKPKNKKAVRKPHNPHERKRRQAEQLVKGFGVAYVTGRDTCDIVDLIANKAFPATLIQAKAMTEFAHKWSMLIVALGIDDQGRKYLKAEQLFLPDRRKQCDLAAGFNDYHQQFIKQSMNPNHLVGAAWIGSPEGSEISIQQADAIFTALGAWGDTTAHAA